LRAHPNVRAAANALCATPPKLSQSQLHTCTPDAARHNSADDQPDKLPQSSGNVTIVNSLIGNWYVNA
jgi:hypothetical protein